MKVMKKLISLLLGLISLTAFSQPAPKTGGVALRVNDSTAYISTQTTAHSQGYADIFWNNQATTPHWDIWNGSSYDHVFTFGGGGTQDLQSVLDEGSTATGPINVSESGFGIEVGGGSAALGQLGGSAGGQFFSEEFGLKILPDKSGPAPVEGSLFIVSSTGYLEELTIGSSNEVLTSDGTTASWATPSYLTPEQYGAVGDDATNDATAFGNLITAASSLGVPIWIPAKTYLISSTLTIPSNLRVMGAGAASILHTTSNIPIFTITSASNVIISDIVFKGSDTGATQRGIYANGNVGFTQLSLQNIITRCGFVDIAQDGIYANFIIGSSTGSNHEGTYQISDCWFTSCPGNGVNFDTRAEYNQISNSKFYLNGVAVRVIGGNNHVNNNSITDNTTGILIGSGTNDGHAMAVGNKINHNGSNVTCTSTATGYSFIGNEIVSGSITLTSCTDIRFYNNDIASAPITSTSAVGTIFMGNCFRTTPTITVAAGNNPVFVFNTFPSGSTVHSLIQNTVQGGVAITQQGPTSPNITTATWTTTASGQYAQRMAGTITPRATTSDATSGMIIDFSHTQTANTQSFYDLDINPTGTLATGGFTGTENGALRTRGRVRLRDLATSGAVTGTSGFTYEKSNGDLIFQWSPDAVFRIGNAGSPWQITSTSDGLAANNNGNGGLITTGGIGANFSATNSATGTTNSRTLGIGGGSTVSSGTTTYSGIRMAYTINQTGTASGNNYGIFHDPTITASLGTSYFIVDNSTLNSGFGTITPVSKLETARSFGANITATSTDITLDGSHYTVVVDASGAARTITLPTAASSTRRIYFIINDTGTNTVTVDGDGGEDIGSTAADTYVIPATAGAAVQIQSNGTKWLILSEL